jgi:hypothetical protein
MKKFELVGKIEGKEKKRSEKDGESVFERD